MRRVAELLNRLENGFQDLLLLWPALGALSMLSSFRTAERRADAVFVHPGWGRSGLSTEEIVDFYDTI